MDINEFEGTARDIKGHVKDAAGGLTGDSQTQVEGKIDQAAGHLQSRYGETVDRVKDAAGDVADKAATYADQAQGRLKDAAETVRTQASAYGGKIYEASTQAGHYVEETVKEQPLLSLIGVAAIGYLIGFLVHSGSSPFAPPPPTPLRRYTTWR